MDKLNLKQGLKHLWLWHDSMTAAIGSGTPESCWQGSASERCARRCRERTTMNLEIRPVCDDDVEDLVRLSLSAWAPVFSSFEQILGHRIYTLIWPDWRTSQRDAVEAVCRDHVKTAVLVAELDERVVGFLAYELNVQDRVGDVTLLAVHPDYQNLGIGTELNNSALEKMKESGMQMARVETGGDPSHAPARRCYEKAGYTPLPIVRYHQSL